MDGPQGERDIIANMSRMHGSDPCLVEAAKSIQTDVRREKLQSNKGVCGLIGGDFNMQSEDLTEVSPGWGLKC
eukprot:9483548-Alexandrium_andersonii.AAC.1